MVEDRMKVMGVSTAASESVCKETYADFDLCAWPYPGTETFAIWSEQDYAGM
jgi:hypothetical protein